MSTLTAPALPASNFIPIKQPQLKHTAIHKTRIWTTCITQDFLYTTADTFPWLKSLDYSCIQLTYSSAHRLNGLLLPLALHEAIVCHSLRYISHCVWYPGFDLVFFWYLFFLFLSSLYCLPDRLTCFFLFFFYIVIWPAFLYHMVSVITLIRTCILPCLPALIHRVKYYKSTIWVYDTMTNLLYINPLQLITHYKQLTTSVSVDPQQ